MNQQALSTTLKHDFQYQTIADTFSLKRNRMDISRRRILYGLCIFLFPTLIANAIFYTYIDLRSIELILVTGIIALILLNLTIYLLNRTTKGNRTLIFGYNDIKILQHSQLIQTILFSELKITRLHWGTEEDNLRPAIRISAKGFPCMTIGSRTATQNWASAPLAEDCTTYLIDQEQDWNRLLSALKYFIQD